MALLENIEAALRPIQELAANLWGDNQPPFLLGILGSGLGELAERFDEKKVRAYIDYSQIPGWPAVGAAGHAGRLWLGTFGGKRVALMQGRGHYYEGLSEEAIMLPIQCFARWGVKLIISTNAAGGLASPKQTGSLMLHSDISGLLSGTTPLRGINDERVGPRFSAPAGYYSPVLNSLMQDIARLSKTDLPVGTGVYGMIPGPLYETGIDARILRALGWDAVGMSVWLEYVAALYAGCPNFMGISCITDFAGETTSHGQVCDMAGRVAPDFARLLEMFVGNLCPEHLRTR